LIWYLIELNQENPYFVKLYRIGKTELLAIM